MRRWARRAALAVAHAGRRVRPTRRIAAPKRPAAPAPWRAGRPGSAARTPTAGAGPTRARRGAAQPTVGFGSAGRLGGGRGRDDPPLRRRALDAGSVGHDRFARRDRRARAGRRMGDRQGQDLAAPVRRRVAGGGDTEAGDRVGAGRHRRAAERRGLDRRWRDEELPRRRGDRQPLFHRPPRRSRLALRRGRRVRPARPRVGRGGERRLGRRRRRRALERALRHQEPEGEAG